MPQYINVSMNLYTYDNMYEVTCVYVCMWLSIHICILFVGVCVCMCVCMYVYICVYVYV